MPTIDAKHIIDKMIENDGHFSDDPRVYMIVEYTNAWDNQTWGVTYFNPPESRMKYLVTSSHVRNPKILWRADGE